MEYLYIVIILVSAVIGVFMTAIGLSGTFIVWGGVFFCAVFNKFNTVGLWLIILFLLFAVLGELIEYFSSVMGARRFGASKKGIIGSLIGAIAGGIVFSVFFIGIGTVIGIFLGTFAGAFAGEYISGKNIASSGKAGFGAFLGRAAAVGIKMIIILVIAIIPVIMYIKDLG